MNSFERTLPAGYEPVFTVDAKEKRTAVRMTVGSLVLTVVPIAIAVLVLRPFAHMEEYSFTGYLLFFAALLLYIVAHELVHGIAYKLLTGQKLTFGLTLTVAYCGVPDIFVYRRTALISLLAPFFFFMPVFLLPGLLLQNVWARMWCLALFGFHFGGCIGDLYDTWLYLTRFRDPATLMQDTGPKQTFYSKTN